MRNLYWFVVAMIAMLTGCAFDPQEMPGDNVADAGNGNTCNAGQKYECPCADGTKSTQTCGVDGKSFGACECSSGTSCTPGQQTNCSCAGGASGTQCCNSDGKSYGTCQCESGNLCTPGQQINCSCQGGGNGIQVCNADAKSYGSCQCGSGNLCTPGAQIDCSCSGGGTGKQSCNADGKSYGSCVCGSPADCNAAVVIDTVIVVIQDTPVAGTHVLNAWWQPPCENVRAWNKVCDLTGSGSGTGSKYSCSFQARRGSIPMEFQINMPNDQGFWGDKSNATYGGHGNTRGTVHLYVGSENSSNEVSYHLVDNKVKDAICPNAGCYFNGWTDEPL
jgi:hypothetical protein